MAAAAGTGADSRKDAGAGAASAPDVFRDSPLRYAGYSNEVGEAFRPLITRHWVHFSDAVAVAYVLGDTADKSARAARDIDRRVTRLAAAKRFADAEALRDTKARAVAISAADTLLWQGLASVAIPGATVNVIVRAATWAGRSARLSKALMQVVPTATGLCAIPLIIHPIDRGVDYALDRWARPRYRLPAAAAHSAPAAHAAAAVASHAPPPAPAAAPQATAAAKPKA